MRKSNLQISIFPDLDDSLDQGDRLNGAVPSSKKDKFHNGTSIFVQNV